MLLSVPDLPGLAPAGLAALPAADTLVLTVNNRLARRLVADLAAGFAPGQRVAEIPRIMPLSAALREMADAHAFLPDAAVAGHRLDAFAAQWLWADVIARAEADRPLLDVAQAAALAADADRQIDEWMLRVPPAMETAESRRLAEWRAAYRKALARADAEDDNLGYENVLRRLEAGAPAGARHVVLAGFGEISPRLGRLLAALRAGGAELAQLQEARDAAAPLRVQAADRHAEWQAAAAWAAQRLRGDPQGRYAIVAAQLQEDAPLARRRLARTLAAGPQGPALAFNVAVGRPLAEWPAARAALAWLAVLAQFAREGACPAPMLGAALLAGHCAGDLRDGGAHAALDAGWRRRQHAVRSLDEWLADLRRCGRLDAAWQHAWQGCQAWGRGRGAAGADAWSRRFRAALAALGFPGDRAQDSVGYQVCEALEAALDRYAGMAVAGRLDAAGAVALLRQLAAATPFQPQRDPSARLDVLGLLEAEGGRWDGIWVLGLSDEVLPATPKPNPLLPAAVLRAAGAPRATPEREREWAHELYQSLCRCAREVVLSHPLLDGERELRPAPLIAALPVAPGPAVEQEAGGIPAGLETLSDERGLPLEPEARTRGGLDVLDTQARNPMWAYVRHRLGARALGDYADDAVAGARGRFLHAALEKVWRMLPDQDALHQAIAAGTLDGLVAQAVALAAERELQQSYGPALRELECRRARSVLAAWLDLEAQRTPFAVAQVEGERHWRRGPLALSLRLDRIDLLPDGRAVIVDYKTGTAVPAPEADWARARPVNLQLPFYAAVLDQAGEEGGAEERPRAGTVHVDGDGGPPASAAGTGNANTGGAGQTPIAADVAGLVLAHVHARQAAAAGLADADLGLAGVQSPQDWEAFAGLDWPAVRARWRGAIEALADEYAAGVAENRSMRRDDLKYCDALPFLRVGREDVDDEAQDAPEAGDD